MPVRWPQVIGHRGACAYAPENTLDSFHTAADVGVSWVECDVMLTRDGVPIIFHDDTLDRTTNGSGNVAERDWAELHELDAGSWFAESFVDVRIPTLEEAIETIIDLGLGLNLEIKPTAGREVETAEVALDYVSRLWDDHDRLLISSFQPPCLETARDMAPDWQRGLLLWHDKMPPDWQELAQYLDVTSVNISNQLATREFIEGIIDLKKAAFVYTINDPMRAKQLIQWGADGVFSDAPDTILEALPKSA